MCVCVCVYAFDRLIKPLSQFHHYDKLPFCSSFYLFCHILAKEKKLASFPNWTPARNKMMSTKSL